MRIQPLHRGRPIEWNGAGVYALVMDPKGQVGWHWVKLENFDLVYATAQNGSEIVFVNFSDLAFEEIENE